jgi:lysophospholipase L1-like esterase
MNLFPVSNRWTGRWLLFLLMAMLPASYRASASLADVFYLGDSYLDDGNYKFLTNPHGNIAPFSSNSQPWSSVVNAALGLPNVGRWTDAGSHSPFGNNYAVCGAGINSSLTGTNTSLHSQIAKLLADYPHGLPSDSMVVIGIGTNDILQDISSFGGIWSTPTSEWKLGNNGFTVPAVGKSVTVPVAGTTGMVPGTTSLVAFLTSSLPLVLALTEVNANGNTVTLTNKYAQPGSQLAPNAVFQICGRWFVDQDLQMLAGDIKSILADHGEVILVLPLPTNMLPVYNRQANQALAHETWKYFYEKMRALVSNGAEKLVSFDLKPIFEEEFADPSRYGFKFNYPGWMGTSSPDPDQYMFWDVAHPSGLMHRHIAQRFLEVLHARGLSK